MLYHMHMDRESLLQASSILDLLAAGWQPGRAELDTARQVDHWMVTPGAAGRPYQLVGTIQIPVPSPLNASVLAIDPQAGWARICDEWIVLARGRPDAPIFDPADVLRSGVAWLIGQRIGLSVH